MISLFFKYIFHCCIFIRLYSLHILLLVLVCSVSITESFIFILSSSKIKFTVFCIHDKHVWYGSAPVSAWSTVFQAKTWVGLVLPQFWAQGQIKSQCTHPPYVAHPGNLKMAVYLWDGSRESPCDEHSMLTSVYETWLNIKCKSSVEL